MTLKFELGLDFCTMHLPTKSHHHTFSRSKVTVLTKTQTTNKWTLLKTSTSLCYVTPVENNFVNLNKVNNGKHYNYSRQHALCVSLHLAVTTSGSDQ